MSEPDDVHTGDFKEPLRLGQQGRRLSFWQKPLTNGFMVALIVLVLLGAVFGTWLGGIL